MKLYFIVNPVAGDGKGIKKVNKIRERLSICHEVFITEYAGHAKKIIEQLPDEPALIIVVGGDGTIHEVIEEIHNKPITLGVVPSGSGNDFSRHFGAYTNTDQINDWMKNKNIKVSDLGSMHGDDNYSFINNGGIGFDAFVVRSVNHSKLKKQLNRIGLGKLAYVYYLIVALFTFKTFELTVHMKSKKEVFKNVWFYTASNQPYFGGGMKIAPNSKADDQLLDITIVHNISKWKILSLFVTVFFGKHTRLKGVHQFQTDEITVEVNQPLYGHLDGEEVQISPNKSYTYNVNHKIKIAKV